MFADRQHLIHDSQVMFQLSRYRSKLRRSQTEEPVDITHCILCNSGKDLFCLFRLIECIIQLSGRKSSPIQRYIFRRQYFHTFVQYIQRLLLLTFLQQVFSQFIEQCSTVALAHTHHVFVDVNARFVYATPFELVHHVVVHLFRVGAFVRLLRNDLVSQTGLFEVTVQTDKLVRIYGDRIINRTFPVIGLQHIQNHQFLFAQSSLTFQADCHFLQ